MDIATVRHSHHRALDVHESQIDQDDAPKNIFFIPKKNKSKLIRGDEMILVVVDVLYSVCTSTDKWECNVP